MINTLPPTWQQSQLDALNQLTALRDAYNVVNDVIKLTADTSPQATQVKSDIQNLAVSLFAIVKSYPQ